MISIVLPVYNAEEYLKKCIACIQAQTYENWELVVIDNGSTDTSCEICRDFAREDSRIEVFHQYQHKGVSVARNLGLERSSGEFITFIDADDWVKPDYLEVLLRTQKKHEADMVVCGYEKIENREVEPEKKLEREYYSRVYSKEEYFRDYMLEGNTHCWAALYRAKKMEEIRFPNKITIGEDLLYLIHGALKMDTIAVSDYQGYEYYINPKGAMLKKFTHEYMDQLVCWQQAKEELTAQFPSLENKINSIIVVSALLVVGKIAQLPSEEQEACREDFRECLQLVREYRKKPEIRKLLPSGYGLKVWLFCLAPKLYLRLYGTKKSLEKK
ncbi:MAG: glycosyltransferase family 2 protein [Lachnospiraceae bacterium]|nr:glycosyltransferase family 2 protein [Lachnospiraceae bacterium]